MDLVTDEDVSDAESEEDFELNETEQRFLHEAYENYGGYMVPLGCSNVAICPLTLGPPLKMLAVCEKGLNNSSTSLSWPLMRIIYGPP